MITAVTDPADVAQVQVELSKLNLGQRKGFGDVLVTTFMTRPPWGSPRLAYRVKRKGNPGKFETPMSNEAAETVVFLVQNPTMQIVGQDYDSRTREGRAFYREEAA